MGSFASRLAGTAATKRKYPQRVPPPARPTPTSSLSSPAAAHPTSTPSAPPLDPTFARSLRILGPVSPPPSPQSTSSQSPSSPALQILAARSRLAAAAEEEFARVARASVGSDDARRRFVDVDTLRRALVMRDGEGVKGEEIERRLGMERGSVGRLGPRGVVGVVPEGEGEEDGR